MYAIRSYYGVLDVGDITRLYRLKIDGHFRQAIEYLGVIV